MATHMATVTERPQAGPGLLPLAGCKESGRSALARDTVVPRHTALALAAAMCVFGANAESVRVQMQLVSGADVLQGHRAGSTSKSDSVISLVPSLSVRALGAQAQFLADVSLEGVAHLQGDSSTSLRPRGQVSLKVSPIENTLHLEASALAERRGANAFDLRPDGLGAANDATYLRTRLMPSFERALTPNLALHLRSEHVWTRIVDVPGAPDPAQSGRATDQLLRLESRPLPLGWALELGHQAGRLSSASEDTIELTTARGVASYAAAEQLTLGASLGRERTRYSLVDRQDTLYGLRARWQPSQRTEIRASYEHRFFGAGIDFEARHRSPYLSLSLRLNRQPVVQAGRYLVDPAGNGVTAILDGILTTRVTDPAARAGAVQSLVSGLGLPAALSGAVDLTSQHAQLHEGATATAVLLGRRSLVSATVYMQRQRRLDQAVDLLLPTGTIGDTEQRGVELRVAHKLSATTAVDAGVRMNRVKGLGEDKGQWSNDNSVRVGLTYTLSPRSSLQFNLRRQLLDSNVVTPTNESALTVRLSQRF